MRRGGRLARRLALAAASGVLAVLASAASAQPPPAPPAAPPSGHPTAPPLPPLPAPSAPAPAPYGTAPAPPLPAPPLAPPPAPAPAPPPAPPAVAPGRAPAPYYSVPPAVPGYGTSATDEERLGPRRLHYREGRPVPPGYYLDTRRNDALIGWGLVLFGVAYAPSMAVGLSSSAKGDRWLVAPVLGPFLDLAARPTEECIERSTGATDCHDVGQEERFWIAFDGVAQAAGATMFVVALATGEKVLVRDDIVRRRDRSPRWAIRPHPVRGGAAIALGGAF